MRELNLGCGKDIREGFINLDIEDYGQEIVRDLDKGLPFDDESVGNIQAKHVLEHVKDIVFVLDEIYRVLEKGGVVGIEVPHVDCDGAFDVKHRRYFNKNSIERIAKDWGYEIKDITVNHKPYINAKLIK